MPPPTDAIPTEIKSFFGKEYHLLILAAVIGVLAGAASTVFRWMIVFFEQVFSGEGLLLGLSAGLAMILMPFMPMLGGLVIGLARRYSPEIVSYSRHLYYPVVDRKGDMIGIISFSDIRDAAQKEGMEETALARDLATHDVMTLKPNHNLDEALTKFSELDVQQMPVVKVGDSKKVIGMLRQSDVQAVYNREILVSELKT